MQPNAKTLPPADDRLKSIAGDGVARTAIDLPADGRVREVDLVTGTVRPVE